MASGPKKNLAWAQGLYKSSSTKKECLGAKRETLDGRTFRYAKSAATLVAGGATQAAAATANHVAQIQTSGAATAAGKTVVAVYVEATAVTANQYDDGYLFFYRGGTGTAGPYYAIASHTTSTAGSEIIYVTLKDPLIGAIAVDDYLSLIPNPWSALAIGTDIAVFPTGQAMCACTTGYYIWVQTGGVSSFKGGDTSAVGMKMSTGTSDHTLLTQAAYTSPVVGAIYATAAVSGYFGPIYMQLD
jgi:hypothetical protein